MNNVTGEPQPKGKINRRDFLKVAGVATGAAVLAGIGGREYLRNIFEKDRKIDMSLFTITIPDRDEKRINYALFHAVFPELIAEEKDGFSFVNKDEKELVLDFSNLAGEKIKLAQNKVDVAFANVSWKDAKKKENQGEVAAGLICRGNFAIRGDVNKQPEFIGEALHRSIMFIGNGTESCKVEDIKLSGLKSFHQEPEGDLNLLSPSYIAADDTNLEVNGVYINHAVSRPEGINATNAQLSKGISVHNAKNSHPLSLNIHASKVDGLEWDAIYSNGYVLINLDNVALFQDRTFKKYHNGGAAVGSTFNSPKGKIIIRKSRLDYAKGAGIWFEPDDHKNQTINIDSKDCNHSPFHWFIGLQPKQKVKLRHTIIQPDWGDLSYGELIYWPIQAKYEGENVGLDFDTLEYRFNESRQGKARLLAFATFDSQAITKFENYGLDKFVRNHIDNFGDILITIDENQFLLTQNNLLKALKNIEESHDGALNPSCMIVDFDLEENLFEIRFFSHCDLEKEEIHFTEPFSVNQKGELVDSIKASKLTSTKLLFRKDIQQSKRLKFT